MIAPNPFRTFGFNDGLETAAQVLEKYMVIPRTSIDAIANEIRALKKVEEAPLKKEVYDRKEQRAIGHFLDAVKARERGLRENSPDKCSYFLQAMEELQKEHFCYD